MYIYICIYIQVRRKLPGKVFARDMTHSNMWHVSFIYVTWLIHIRDITHSYIWHDSFTGITGLIRIYDMTHSNLCHDSYICIYVYIQVCQKLSGKSFVPSFPCRPVVVMNIGRNSQQSACKPIYQIRQLQCRHSRISTTVNTDRNSQMSMI